MRTDDGGENWTVVQPANPDLNWVQEIYFYNLQDGYMTRSYGEFLSTSDGGESWDLNSIGDIRVNYRKIIFTDSTNGWMIGMEVIMHGPGYIWQLSNRVTKQSHPANS